MGGVWKPNFNNVSGARRLLRAVAVALGLTLAAAGCGSVGTTHSDAGSTGGASGAGTGGARGTGGSPADGSAGTGGAPADGSAGTGGAPADGSAGTGGAPADGGIVPAKWDVDLWDTAIWS
jgi:hypothetical protein